MSGRLYTYTLLVERLAELCEDARCEGDVIPENALRSCLAYFALHPICLTLGKITLCGTPDDTLIARWFAEDGTQTFKQEYR